MDNNGQNRPESPDESRRKSRSSSPPVLTFTKQPATRDSSGQVTEWIIRADGLVIGTVKHEVRGYAAEDRRWSWFSYLIGGDRGLVATEAEALDAIKRCAIGCVERDGRLRFAGRPGR